MADQVQLSLSLPADARAVPSLRRALRELPGRSLPRDADDDLAAVLSELVTNAILHSSSSVEVRVLAAGSGWRVEVRDDGVPDLVPLPRTSRNEPVAGELPSTTGRGLVIVQALSERWGIVRDGAGSLVWADIATGTGSGGLDGGPPPHPASIWATAVGAPAEGGAVVPVRLLAIPRRLLVASHRHLDDLLREVSVVALGDPAARERLVAVRERIGALGNVLAASRASVPAEGAATRRLVDIDLPLRPADARATEELLELLDVLAEESRSGRLLTLPPPDEVVAFRRWGAAEMRAQMEGAPPRVCPFPVRPVRASAEPVAAESPHAILLRDLQQVTGALAGVDDTAALHRVVLRDLRSITGALLCALYLLQDNGSIRMLADPATVPEDVSERWGDIDASADVPVTEVARTGQAVFIGDEPEMLADWPAVQGQPRLPVQASAVLPLVVAEGQVIGSLLLSFTDARSWTEDDRTVLLLLADSVAQALERTRLRDQERAAVRRIEMLARAGETLASSLDADEVLRALADLAVPELGDLCAVHERRGSAVDTVAVAGVDPPALAAAHELSRRWPAQAGAGAIGRALAQGEVVQWQQMPDELLRASTPDDERYALLRALGIGAGLIVPLRSAGRVVATLTAIRRPGRPITSGDLDLAYGLANRAAAALTNATLFAEARDRVRALQQTLLPPTLPDVEGLELGVSYSAAGGGEEVGGDFYDAVEVEGALVFTTGDVRGRGVEAAAIAGLARHTIRSLAWLGLAPVEVLRLLNRALRLESEGRDEPAFCTAVLGRVVPRAGGAAVCLASAGHPAPFIVRRDGPVERPATRGDLLGLLPEPDLTEVECELEPGDLLVLVTDGVLERRSDDGRLLEDAGVERVLERHRDAPAQRVADALDEAVRDFAAAPPGDDMAVLVLRLPR